MILAYIRTIIIYLILIFSVRLMGKRQIGQMEATEFVVAMLIADLAAVPMQDGSIPLLSGIVPLLTVLGLEIVMSFLILKGSCPADFCTLQISQAILQSRIFSGAFLPCASGSILRPSF